jgi:hypothetical protein
MVREILKPRSAILRDVCESYRGIEVSSRSGSAIMHDVGESNRVVEVTKFERRHYRSRMDQQNRGLRPCGSVRQCRLLGSMSLK